MPPLSADSCPLCHPDHEKVLLGSASLRIIVADEPDYPGVCRVIWNRHITEMTDLQTAERECLMRTVWATEQALRELLKPAKINLASLGNRVSHLHWHVIPRFANDPTFPDAIWAEPVRPAPARKLPSHFAESVAGRLRKVLERP